MHPTGRMAKWIHLLRSEFQSKSPDWFPLTSIPVTCTHPEHGLSPTIKWWLTNRSPKRAFSQQTVGSTRQKTGFARLFLANHTETIGWWAPSPQWQTLSGGYGGSLWLCEGMHGTRLITHYTFGSDRRCNPEVIKQKPEMVPLKSDISPKDTQRCFLCQQTRCDHTPKTGCLILKVGVGLNPPGLIFGGSPLSKSPQLQLD